jgi:hypothetical protein
VRPASATLAGVLSGPFDHFFVADVYYDGERRLEGVPLSDVRFDEDGDAQIQQSGSCTIVWTDAFASSVTPREVSDVLAPFGAELFLYSMVWAGPFVERVPLGQFTITDVPSALDEDMLFRGEWVTVGSVVELEFKERTAAVQDDRFDVPGAASDLSSTWAELGRLWGLQLLRTVPDRPIPRTVVYQDDRVDAGYDLMAVLDAVPHVTADGVLSGRPNVWPAPVAALRRGEGGCLVEVGNSMRRSKVYNRVAFRGKSGDAEVILAAAEVPSGPLRARNADGSRSPFGRKTYFVSSEYVSTRTQAQDFVDRELPRVSSLASAVVPFTMTFDPRLERGDVVTIERGREVLLGRIITLSRGVGGRQDGTAEVRLG